MGTVKSPQICLGSMSARILFIVSNLKSESNWLTKGKFLAHTTEKPGGRSGDRWVGIQECSIDRDPVLSSLSPWLPKLIPCLIFSSLEDVCHESQSHRSSSTDRRIKSSSFPILPSCTPTAPFRSATLLIPVAPVWGEILTAS